MVYNLVSYFGNPSLLQSLCFNCMMKIKWSKYLLVLWLFWNKQTQKPNYIKTLPIYIYIGWKPWNSNQHLIFHCWAWVFQLWHQILFNVLTVQTTISSSSNDISRYQSKSLVQFWKCPSSYLLPLLQIRREIQVE